METPSSNAPVNWSGLLTKKVIFIILGVILVTSGIAAATTAWWVKHTLYPAPHTARHSDGLGAGGA